MKIYEKWRELKTDPRDIHFKKIKLLRKISFPHYDELYFYDSQYFKYLMKNSKFYMELIKLYKKYNFRIILNLLNISISKRYVKIPLFSFKSIYYANKELSNFSFLELNYDLIPNESFLNKNKTKK